MIFRAGEFSYDFAGDFRVLVMGILNVTPDSFSDGGVLESADAAVKKALYMIDMGADILDIGAESTRPGAELVSTNEELGRILPVLDALVCDERVCVPISIDTSKAEVARECLRRGASIINDVTGFKGDDAMAAVVADSNAGAVLMHMRGTPSDMQLRCEYRDVVADVCFELKESLHLAKKAGISDERIMLDPGIGFSKDVDQNIEIMRRLDEFSVLGRPLLVGASRKSFIGKSLNRQVDERLAGSLAAVNAAADKGAAVVRVHDVMDSRDFLDMKYIFEDRNGS